MIVFKSFHDWKKFKTKHLNAKTIGLVPTMGNLHRGHLSLCAASKLQNDVTVVTIFVNPKQFNESADFTRYPRTLPQDIALLEQHEVDYCITPSEEEIYADNYTYQVSEKNLSLMLEGEFRPGHFTGVLTVVLKILLAVGAQRAYFGEKDYQQYLLIRGMVESLWLDCEIIVCPIVRESSGLPFSSRNSLLSADQRKLADSVATIFNNKDVSLDEIRQQLMALDITIDYLLEIFNRRIMAVRVGNVRLLDNYAHF